MLGPQAPNLNRRGSDIHYKGKGATTPYRPRKPSSNDKVHGNSCVQFRRIHELVELPLGDLIFLESKSSAASSNGAANSSGGFRFDD
jgi:hypothetical protein